MLPDHGPSDLVVALSCGLNRVPRHVVERDHVGEDAHRLIEGTEPVDVCKQFVIVPRLDQMFEVMVY